MFPSQPSDDLVVRHPIPSACVRSQPNQIQEDLVTSAHIYHHQVQQVNNDEKNMEGKLKRIMHKDVERQRRQEMANLHASLRSLLPIQHIKGKRSICDHLDEAVTYIKHLEKDVQKLHMQRDKLKKLPNSGVEITNRSDHDSHTCVTVNQCQHDLELQRGKLKRLHNSGVEITNRSDCDSHTCVTVNQCQGDLEILISDGVKDEAPKIPLSKVLGKLSEEGLSVVSCCFARNKDRSLHTIQCEVSDMTSIDLKKLQEEIADLISYNFNTE